MKKMLSYWREHWAVHGGLRMLLGMAVLIGGGLVWRYGLGNDPFFAGSPYSLLWGIAFYAVPYFGAVACYAWQHGQWAVFKKGGFWWVSLSLLFVVYANQFLLGYRPLIIENVPPETARFWWKIIFNLHTSCFYLLVPLIWYWVADRGRMPSFYGLTVKGFHAKPYLIMLALMAPLLLWASYQPDFLRTYPRYSTGTAEVYWAVSPFMTVGAYQLTYAFQFLALEVFFRGFMNEKLRPYLGEGAVFVMASVYCYIHFGKPMAEAISSVFGGYLLGVVAMRTGSVMGGVMVHVGIALGMEWLAHWRK